MAKLIQLSNTSWKQPFADKKKDFHLWNIHSKVKDFCKVGDNTKRLLNINFEDRFNINETRLFQITSGREISFPKDFQDRIKVTILNNPQSYFTVTILDSVIEYTPADIIWVKNVTNKEIGSAYLDISDEEFVLHFPNKFGDSKNIQSPKVDDIILIWQIVNGTPAFTHLVTPINTKREENKTRSNYRFGRNVRVIARTNINNVIPVSSTLWNKVKFQGISNGNVCKIENMKNLLNIEELRFNIWQKFSPYFLPNMEQYATNTVSIFKELEITNPELTVIEGKLYLVSHLARERNREIVKLKKQIAFENNSLFCEVCEFSFPETYQFNFIECHHIIPIGNSGIRNTNLDDLALVCSNCHRMLHVKFKGKYFSMEDLKQHMKNLKGKLN